MDKSLFIQELLISSIENFFRHDLKFKKNVDKKRSIDLDDSLVKLDENEPTNDKSAEQSNEEKNEHLTQSSGQPSQSTTTTTNQSNNGELSNQLSQLTTNQQTNQTSNNTTNHSSNRYSTELNQTNEINNQQLTQNDKFNQESRDGHLHELTASSTDVDLRPADLAGTKIKGEQASNEPNNDEQSAK